MFITWESIFALTRLKHQTEILWRLFLFLQNGPQSSQSKKQKILDLFLTKNICSPIQTKNMVSSQENIKNAPDQDKSIERSFNFSKVATTCSKDLSRSGNGKGFEDF